MNRIPVRLLVFIASLASAIPFALCVIVARFFISEALPQIIFLQTSTAFGAFVIQAGLRAGLRKEYVEGRRRIVTYTTLSFISYGRTLSLWLAPFFIFFPFGFKFLPILATANASLTLILGLSMLKGEHLPAIRASFSLFGLNLLAGATAIALNGFPVTSAVVTEVVSFLCLSVLIKSMTTKQGKRVSIRPLLLIAKKYFTLQLGSFLILSSSFLLSLICIRWDYDFPGLLKQYAEISVICNIVILIGARAIMMHEGEFLLNGKAFVLLVSIHLVVAVGITLLGVFYHGRSSTVAVLLSSFFLGQYALSSISQYVKERYRFIVLLASAIPAAMLAVLTYLYPYFGLTPKIEILYLNNMTVSLVAFLALYVAVGKQAFIGMKSNDAS